MAETRQCSWCGDTIERAPSRFVNQRTGKEYERHFCDRGCRGAWESEHQSGDDHPQYNHVTVECDWCGDTKDVKPTDAERVEHHFCDRDCMGRWFSTNRRGDDHHRWKGGPVGAYGPGWTRARREARERDGYECVSCGMTDDEHLNKFNRELEVHHVTPIPADTDAPEQYHELTNLKTLCRPCHRQEHAESDTQTTTP